jgi:hypothetical protein
MEDGCKMCTQSLAYEYLTNLLTLIDRNVMKTIPIVTFEIKSRISTNLVVKRKLNNNVLASNTYGGPVMFSMQEGGNGQECIYFWIFLSQN